MENISMAQTFTCYLYSNGGTFYDISRGELTSGVNPFISDASILTDPTEYFSTSGSNLKILRDGYSFVEWNSQADGTGTSYPAGSTATEGASYYAIWQLIEELRLTTTAELTSIADAIRAKSGLNSTLSYPDGFVEAINEIPSDEGPSEFNVAHLRMVRTADTGLVYAFCPILNDTTNRLEFKNIKITTTETEITCLFSNKYTFPTFINIMASATSLSDASSGDGNTLHFGNFWNHPNGTSRYYTVTLATPTSDGSVENDLITLTVG